jgi:hypothetical protein
VTDTINEIQKALLEAFLLLRAIVYLLLAASPGL